MYTYIHIYIYLRPKIIELMSHLKRDPLCTLTFSVAFNTCVVGTSWVVREHSGSGLSLLSFKAN